MCSGLECYFLCKYAYNEICLDHIIDNNRYETQTKMCA